jgi:hypothetical protein
MSKVASPLPAQSQISPAAATATGYVAIVVFASGRDEVAATDVSDRPGRSRATLVGRSSGLPRRSRLSDVNVEGADGRRLRRLAVGRTTAVGVRRRRFRVDDGRVPGPVAVRRRQRRRRTPSAAVVVARPTAEGSSRSDSAVFDARRTAGTVRRLHDTSTDVGAGDRRSTIVARPKTIIGAAATSASPNRRQRNG